MNAIITTCCLATLALTQTSPPSNATQLAEPLRQYSWLVGTWKTDRISFIECDKDGSSYLMFNSDVKILPVDSGTALEITYSLEGSVAAFVGFDVPVTERVTVDPKTLHVLATVTYRDTCNDNFNGASKEGKSEYILSRSSENVWEGESNGTHRKKPTHCKMRVTREDDNTLAIAITNRMDRSPSGQGQILVKLKRAVVSPSPTR